MYMQDWITKLDDFLLLSGRELLQHAGTISHEAAVRKAEKEFEEFKKKQRALPSKVEQDFEEAIKQLPETSKQGYE